MEELISNSRREFIKKVGGMTALVALGFKTNDVFARDHITKVTILHTNDVHSRIDPFPMDGSRNQGLGGVARRSSLIKKIRAEEKNVLLLDAGDIFQGTPYFNYYGGELELKLMSQMGYDASTIGNHDFDNGLEGFYKQLPNATFPFICSNYDFSDTILHNRTIPYKIFNKDGVRIGVFGLGIELEGLVEKKNYGETIYLDPIKEAQKYASLLKNEMKCNLVICLSHLGYKYKNNKVSDIILAQNTKHIDLIIGGHTHTFMQKPDVLENVENKEVQIFQVGFAGINLGRIDFYFDQQKGKKQSVASTLVIDEKLQIG